MFTIYVCINLYLFAYGIITIIQYVLCNVYFIKQLEISCSYTLVSFLVLPRSNRLHERKMAFLWDSESDLLFLSLQISLEFQNLGKDYQDVISDICHRMGVGMAEFLEKKVVSMQEWDKVTPFGFLY